MKKKNIILVILLLTLVVFIPRVSASAFIKTGDTLDEVGDYTDSVYIAGNNLTTKINTTDGIYLAGNTINVDGTSEYAYLIGSNINTKGSIVKDAYLIGMNVTSEGTIGKDLYAVGQYVKVDGIVNGDVYLAGENIVINTTINGNVIVAAENIKLTSDAKIIGKFSYNNDAVLTKDNSSSIGSSTTYTAYNNNQTFASDASTILYDYLNILVVGLILLYWAPSLFKHIKKNVDLSPKAIIGTMGNGLLDMIVIPFIALLLCIFRFGLSTSIIMLMLEALMIYIALIVVAYVIADNVKQLNITKNENKYVSFALALGLIYLVKFIPYVGTIVIFLCTCYGFGMLIKLVLKKS